MYWLSVLPVAVLAAVPFGLTIPLSPRWDDMRAKHAWGSIPGKWECQGVGVNGTSCSTPTAAGVISLLNDFLISKGKSPLGFLNPLIYSTAAAGFNDITSGSNPGCGTLGFSATKGWDPVTGMGTPDFVKLQGIVG